MSAACLLPPGLSRASGALRHGNAAGTAWPGTARPAGFRQACLELTSGALVLSILNDFALSKALVLSVSRLAGPAVQFPIILPRNSRTPHTGLLRSDIGVCTHHVRVLQPTRRIPIAHLCTRTPGKYLHPLSQPASALRKIALQDMPRKT